VRACGGQTPGQHSQRGTHVASSDSHGGSVGSCASACPGCKLAGSTAALPSLSHRRLSSFPALLQSLPLILAGSMLLDHTPSAHSQEQKVMVPEAC